MAFTTNEWRPTPKQEIFLSLPLTIKEALYGGGAGSAKTDVLLIYAIARGWHKHPGFKQVFLRRTFPELRNEIVPRSRQLYPKFGATFNKGDMAWTFPAPGQEGSGFANGGAVIFLTQCENEDDVHKYDSMEINLFTPDEVQSLTEYIYMYIGFTRVRTSDKDLPAIIRAGGMPGNVGHTFIRRRFVDPSPPPHDRKVIVGKGGVKRIYIHATVADNPHIDPDYKRSLEALTEAEKRAKLYGDWNAYLGQVFEEFRDKQFPDEPENALHVVEPFDIPDWWPRIVIGDWGFAAQTWIGFGAISPEKRLIVYRELAWTQTKIEEWAPELRTIIERENPRLVKFCRSAAQERGQEHTIEEQISSALGRQIELTNNNAGSRVAGKQLIHEYLRWKPKPVASQQDIRTYNEEHALFILRNRGMKEYNSYLNSFNPAEPENNLPKLQIFDTCPILINAIKACSYDKKRVEDIAAFDGDDPIDALRYMVDAASSFFESATEEFSRVQKQNELLARVARTQDWTAFYRDMRTLETQETYKPVQMVHRRRR